MYRVVFHRIGIIGPEAASRTHREKRFFLLQRAQRKSTRVPRLAPSLSDAFWALFGYSPPTRINGQFWVRKCSFPMENAHLLLNGYTFSATTLRQNGGAIWACISSSWLRQMALAHIYIAASRRYASTRKHVNNSVCMTIVAHRWLNCLPG